MYTIIPSFTKCFEIMVAATLRKAWDLPCQKGAMPHISRNTKRHRQHALFL